MCAENGNCFTIIEEESEEEQKIRHKGIEQTQEILDYAAQRYGCKFPKRFATKMYYASYNGWIPSKKVIDTLILEWNIWAQYLSPESFQRFMLNGIESMFRLHTTSTFNVSTLKGYVGNKAEVVKQLPANLTTTVLMDGGIRLNGRELRI